MLFLAQTDVASTITSVSELLPIVVQIGVAILLFVLGRSLVMAIIAEKEANDPDNYEDCSEEFVPGSIWEAKSEMQDDVLDALIADEITQEEATELWEKHDY